MSVELVIFGFILMGVCAGFVYLFLRAFYRGSFINALIFKGVASLCFVIFAALNCFTNEISPSDVIIFVALCLGIVGDEVIALCQIFPKHDMRAFIGGGSSFLVGHLLYITSLILLGGVSWIAMIVTLLSLMALGGWYSKRRGFLAGDTKVMLTLYLGIVISFAAVAVGVFIKRPTFGTGLIAIGGLLFAVSDNILFAYKLGEKPKFRQNIALHVAYYLAQFSIAWSILFL